MIIYKVTNLINSKLYIGQTVQKIEKRWKNHQNKGDALYNAIKKYGANNFIIEQIDSSDNIDDLNNKEIKWILEYNSLAPNGYNIREGGKSGGKFSEQGRENIRKSLLGRPVSEKTRKLKSEQMSGENNPMYGKSPNWGKECKPETRKKISESQKGKIISEEQKIKLRSYRLGVPGWRKGKKFGNSIGQKNQFKFEVYKKDGTFVGIWESQKICAQDLGICHKGINTVLKGKRPSHKGYIFKKCENTSN